ncbi:putative DNA helicase [Anaeromyces robustus]|uniref:Putative DNA helicase n=1 Tax=Anaeromyces robustus TaxID=1754192 RepID=A0A1Y1X4F1_9FUNG|nr:putative DNA helicase [Anaeromyces robustus]|eukprot:ORX80691.1 putative DNA helicase [Anaeromyces robustus]
MNIGDNISKGIKECKWLNISYINNRNENTFFWIAVQDIDFDHHKLKVSVFNDKRALNTFETWITYESILEAEIIEFTSYERPEELISKIENNIEKCEWLNYDHFNNNILNYYEECNYLDNDPTQSEYTCVPGIDLEKLMENFKLPLEEFQTKKIIADIYHYNISDISNKYYTLAINKLSIDINKKKYVVGYYELTFDPKQNSLIANHDLRFNYSFMIEGRRHSLFNYINMDIDEFTETFSERYMEYHDLIIQNLKYGEYINTKPEIMLLEREIKVKLKETFQVIEEKYQAKNLPIPLKSFFGNFTKRNYKKKKKPSLIIYDDRININQMRVLYNAMKYPITYVHGPPGTGKTQTILNVILSSFYNDKTTLICSSNNKPVDGIIEKLSLSYCNNSIPFPYLRLGKNSEVKMATLKIRDFYNIPIDNNNNRMDELLSNIRIFDDSYQSNLIESLEKQEKRFEIEESIRCSEKLIEAFEENEDNFCESYLKIKEKIRLLREELETIPEITNEQLKDLYTSIDNNYLLTQYFYYKSLKYISKLKKPKYNELICICNMEDDKKRVIEFNRWCSDDSNMKLLTKVFPVIFSTNISTGKLGTPRFMFDLVVMDEAGQCNVATALIPITKAKTLLLIGDPKQLKPVIVLEENVNIILMEKYNVKESYNYKTHSIFHVMTENDKISKNILLGYHYRCGRKIINFSNQRYYNNSLDLIHTREEGQLELVNVMNQNVKNKNEAYDEASAIIQYIKRNDVHDAYIITPFVNQKLLIENMLKSSNINDIQCGTIHSLQGAEKKTIIFSLAISQKTSKKTYEWVKNNFELINVGVTRAKSKLVIAADTTCIDKFSDKNDDIFNLIQYVKNEGNMIIPPNESIRIEIGYSNGSIAEDEFYKTISHFCSCYKKFKAKRNIIVSKFLRNERSPQYKNLEFDLVLFSVKDENENLIEKPLVAFEICGGEHLGNLASERSDRKKMAICNRNDIVFHMIPNNMVKHYEYIMEVILSLR